jgi:hypothetical protein
MVDDTAWDREDAGSSPASPTKLKWGSDVIGSHARLRLWCESV